MTERVLLLSLLRAGDALVHLPALAALAKPGRELHVLLQRAGGPAAELLATFATIHVLPVNYTGGDAAPLAPLLASLRARAFSRVVNLTLKPFAAELGEAIAPGRVEGFALVEGRPVLTSPWLRLLNDWGTAAPLSVIHYADIFAQALGAARPSPALVPGAANERWWAEARAQLALDSRAPLVLVQLSTSEVKKTYPRPLFLELCALLATALPGAALLALAAPAESAEVAAFCAGTGGRVRPLVCSLAQAACALRDAELLITGDTALVHLGALCGTRVLLLSSGSSAFRELGPAGPGHIVLHANYPCAPCRHDLACVVRSDGVYPCTEAVPPACAAQVARALVEESPLPLETPRLVRAYASRLDARGLVDFLPLGAPSPADVCAALLREHLLAQQDVACAPGAAAALSPDAAPLAPESRAALASMAEVLDALSLRAKDGDGARLTPALRGAREYLVLELAKQLAGRLRERPREPGDARQRALLDELALLRARIAARLES